MDIAAKVEEMKRKAEALAREAARRSGELTGSADPAESNAPSSEDD